MQSAIGQQLAAAARQRRIALAIGIATVTIDFVIIKQHRGLELRFALALCAFAAIVSVVDGDLASVGLRAGPKQGWKPWIMTSLGIGLVVALCIALWLAALHLFGDQIPIYSTAPTHIVNRFQQMCVVAPVLEEAIYRIVVCVSLVAVIGCWRTIAISGFLFGLLHVVYGNPSPENLVGGFFLTWAYLKSESVVLPVLLHSIGNGLALGAQVAAWYYLN